MIELRSQTWCVASLSDSAGFQVPHSDAILFYVVLDGAVRLTSGTRNTIRLEKHEIAIVSSGDVHALRASPRSAMIDFKTLTSGEYLDAPREVALGSGPRACQLLCGRLKPRWPGVGRPSGLPPVLLTKVSDTLVDIPRMVELAQECGGSATLTKMASLIFVNTFRAHPTSEQIFHDSGYSGPIARAVQFIEMHPFIDWTVARLADKVGMGRSAFASHFVTEVGKTPWAVVVEERMKRAAMLLEQTDLKLLDIADRIGYRSESAFSHRFKAHFGATPGRVRKEKRRLPVKP